MRKEGADMNNKWDYLKEKYPAYISKDQLYRICQISKESAKWLLDNRVIPCECSGKLTRRYKIALVDVIKYLKKREQSGDSLFNVVNLTKQIKKNDENT